jgi:peptidoglycan lytic transglycosylase
MFSMRAIIIVLGATSAAAMLPLDLAKADQVGHASWYALHSRTASGEQMDPGAMTAAHPSLPFGTQVLVENLSNGRSVVVRINDRGPFVAGRIIDVSQAAASTLGMIGSGTANVRVSAAGGGGTAASRSAANVVGGGLLRSAPKATQIAARQRSHKDVAVASAKPAQVETNNDRFKGASTASAANPYSGILGRAPGFMQVGEADRSRGTRQNLSRFASEG